MRSARRRPWLSHPETKRDERAAGIIARERATTTTTTTTGVCVRMCVGERKEANFSIGLLQSRERFGRSLSGSSTRRCYQSPRLHTLPAAVCIARPRRRSCTRGHRFLPPRSLAVRARTYSGIRIVRLITAVVVLKSPALFANDFAG